MREICKSCTDKLSCIDICPKLGEMLDEVCQSNKHTPEIAVSQLPQKNAEGEEIDPSIDDFRNIDAAHLYDNVEDTKISWDNVPLPTNEVFPPEIQKILNKFIDNAIPLGKKKQKRRFNDFLNCTKISKIAEKANTSKQNIQKQFQATVKRVHKMLSGSSNVVGKTITPLQFKAKII